METAVEKLLKDTKSFTDAVNSELCSAFLILLVSLLRLAPTRSLHSRGRIQYPFLHHFPSDFGRIWPYWQEPRICTYNQECHQIRDHDGGASVGCRTWTWADRKQNSWAYQRIPDCHEDYSENHHKEGPQSSCYHSNVLIVYLPLDLCQLVDYDRFNNSLTKLRDKKEKSLSDEKNLFKVIIWQLSALHSYLISCAAWTRFRIGNQRIRLH